MSYIKINNIWKLISKGFKKENGEWIELNDISSPFLGETIIKNYVDYSSPGMASSSFLAINSLSDLQKANGYTGSIITNSGVTESSEVPPNTSFTKSLYFNGSSFLTLNNYNFGANNFTIEWWEKSTNSSSGTRFMSTYGTSGGTEAGMMIGWWCTTHRMPEIKWTSYNSYSSWNVIGHNISAGNVDTSDWHHMAYVRNGSNLYVIKDGALINTIAVSTYAVGYNGSLPMCFGRRGSNSANSTCFSGYLCGIRLSNTALYTQFGTYEERVEPDLSLKYKYSDLGQDKNTLLLLNGSLEDDDFYTHNFSNLPTPTSLPAVTSGPNMAELGYKGCYYFNNISNCNFKIDDTNFSNGDFCLEWWQLPTVTTQAQASCILGMSTNGSTYGGLLLGWNNSYIYAAQSTSSWDIFNGISINNSWNTASTTSWTHFALDKKGIKYYLYKNGEIIWQGVNSTGLHPFNNKTWYLGYNWSGYITGLRISKTSRYIDPWYNTDISKPEYATPIIDNLLNSGQNAQEYYGVSNTNEIPGFGIDVTSNDNPQPENLMGAVMWWSIDATTSTGIKRFSITPITNNIGHAYTQTGMPTGSQSSIECPICASSTGYRTCVDLQYIGIAGNGMYFRDASNNILSCASLFNNNDWTIEYWEYRKSTDPVGSAAIIIGTDTNRTTDYGGIKLGYDNGTNQRMLFSTTGTSWDSSNVLFGNRLHDQWVHRAFVSHGGFCYSYENGKLTNIIGRPTWGFYSDNRIHIGCGGTHALIPYVAFWYGAKWTADFIPKKEIFY